jgi:glycosyltransferase involved in cell wall biosynthesis
MPGSPQFTVIIPTRERADTLLHCMRTVVEQDYDGLTILVSDNASIDHTRDVVESFSDSRIHYVNTGRRVSMSQNWEFALEHVKRGWVGFLGDDDGLLPSAFVRLADVIKESRCSAVKAKSCFYFWPDSTSQANELRIPTTAGMEIRDGVKWLNKLMLGSANYLDLPVLYTGGFANTSLVQRARNHDGRFFLSMTPDVYSAVAIA